MRFCAFEPYKANLVVCGLSHRGTKVKYRTRDDPI